MKREFLQNLKIGDQALTKEIIDAVMAENGRDIQAAKDAYKDYDAIKEQLETAKTSLAELQKADISGLQEKIKTLTADLKQKDADWQAKLDGMTFDSTIKDAITAAGGRNAKAIRALLDIDTLKASKDQTKDIQAAIEALKGSDSYLFGTDKQTPPPFSTGTGTGAGTGGSDDALAKFYKAAGVDLSKD